ncbi:MAG: TSCPD domain-containing protein [Candidatus Onthovivens sp.]|nr:TSCPD domain-containing protein [Candidatus Onthovivens sp.]
MIKEYTHKNHGTCSQSVTITYDDETKKIISVVFNRGCPGNTQGVSKLCVGRDLVEVRDLLKGTDCGGRGTSCPNELSKAIDDILNTL